MLEIGHSREYCFFSVCWEDVVEFGDAKNPRFTNNTKSSLFWQGWGSKSLYHRFIATQKKNRSEHILHKFHIHASIGNPKKKSRSYQGVVVTKKTKTSSNLTACSATPRNVNMEPENTLRAPWKRRKSSSNQTIIFLQLRTVDLWGCILVAWLTIPPEDINILSNLADDSPWEKENHMLVSKLSHFELTTKKTHYNTWDSSIIIQHFRGVHLWIMYTLED